MSLTRQQLRATGRQVIAEHVAQHVRDAGNGIVPRRQRRAMARQLEREGWQKRDRKAIETKKALQSIAEKEFAKALKCPPKTSN